MRGFSAFIDQLTGPVSYLITFAVKNIFILFLPHKVSQTHCEH